MGKIGQIIFMLMVVSVATLVLPGTEVAVAQGKITLKECVDIAIQKNVGVIAASNGYKSSQYSLLDSWMNALPSASTSANYSYRKSYGKLYDPNTNQLYENPGTRNYSTGLSFNMTLFDGGATWFGIKQSSLQSTSSQNNMRATIQNTALTVKQAYYTLVQALLLRKVQEDALARSKKQLEVTSSKFELGSASLSDKLKAEVLVAQDSVTLLQRDNDIKNAEFNLNLILNRDVNTPIDPVDTLAQTDFTMSLDECLQVALADNPTLKKSQADYDVTRTSVWLARSNWVPRVGASAGWGWSTRKGSDWFAYKKDNASYSFGISISYDLFDGLHKKTDYSRAKLSENTQRESHDADRNNLIFQVRQSYLNIVTARLQYQTAQLAEQSAQEDMKLQSERYRLGASSILDLLDAQLSLTNAQYSRVQALYQLNISVASMTKALGRL
jgi:outer membrane protein